MHKIHNDLNVVQGQANEQESSYFPSSSATSNHNYANEVNVDADADTDVVNPQTSHPKQGELYDETPASTTPTTSSVKKLKLKQLSRTIN